MCLLLCVLDLSHISRYDITPSASGYISIYIVNSALKISMVYAFMTVLIKSLWVTLFYTQSYQLVPLRY